MQHGVITKRVWGAALSLGLVAVAITLFSVKGKSSAEVGGLIASPMVINKEMIAAQLGMAIRGNLFPQVLDLSVDGGVKKTQVHYSLHEESQSQMQRLMGLYRPDYGAFVAIDARSGRILSLVSYSREKHVENLALQATFPAASIFKVVTASAALDLNKANPSTIVPFNGAYHTLYKKNVVDNRENRWTRYITMREAFARSVNTFFSKLGLFYVGPTNLLQYAERYNFNHPIRADVPVQTGYARIATDDPWSVATAASGFTRDNTMSPIQGALIAAAVANDGVMMEPYIVESLLDQATGQSVYQVQPAQASVVVDKLAAEKLRELFNETVRSGTSRKSFRKTVRRSSWDDVEFGGKTGSLTGLNPAGKCDWFVGYARYRDQRIAVAALTVNEKKWRVKSSLLANEFLTTYMKRIKSSDIAKQ
jgi:cell division protein FtsI/penicillin-binding protein 2